MRKKHEINFLVKQLADWFVCVTCWDSLLECGNVQVRIIAYYEVEHGRQILQNLIVNLWSLQLSKIRRKSLTNSDFQKCLKCAEAREKLKNLAKQQK